jgi:diguanylate cyclase (GGDEF)-like protein
MIKRLLSKRIFNWISIFLCFLIILSASYYFIVSQSKVRTIDAGFAMLNQISGQNSIISALSSAVDSVFNLATIQVLLFLLICVCLMVLLLFIYRLYSIQKLNSLIDPLTRLYDTRAIKFALYREVERARKFGHSLNVAILDMDHFVKFNHHYGKEKGDIVLKKIGQIIDKSIMPTDIAGRISGEEFLILFPEVNLVSAKNICERIISMIRFGNFDSAKVMGKSGLTASIGLYSLDIKSEKRIDVLEEVQKKLYLARLAGRDCVR